MTARDPALTAPADRWSALSVPHGRIEAHMERALQSGHELSVREYAPAAARPTSSAALREALDQAARDPGLTPLVKAVEGVEAVEEIRAPAGV
ncbi:hypothetical protein OG552_04130 [Streptomyces sp. NBC_01476]|uniref:hypothetical protein n=1 Tax=Streptomyces sp. NBC_01476 TaxID=2903881 RepID=UPI002E37442A|nr:hypothetical protein [Streptomyces sp. NBC_01476]